MMITTKSRRKGKRQSSFLLVWLTVFVSSSSSVLKPTFGFILPHSNTIIQVRRRRTTSEDEQLLLPFSAVATSFQSQRLPLYHQNPPHQKSRRRGTRMTTLALASSCTTAAATNNNANAANSTSVDDGMIRIVNGHQRSRSSSSSSPSSSSKPHSSKQHRRNEKQSNKSNHHHGDRSNDPQSHYRPKNKVVKPKPKQQQKHKPKLSHVEKEFQWLNWVYCQWKDLEAGTIPLTVLKQMEPAISTWGRRSTKIKPKETAIGGGNSLSYNAERAEEILERFIVEYVNGNPNIIADDNGNDGATKEGGTGSDSSANVGSTATDAQQHAASSSPSATSNPAPTKSPPPKSSSSSPTSSAAGAVAPAPAPIKLKVATFNAAMDAYAKIGNPEGVQRILRRMNELRQQQPTTSSTTLSPPARSLSYLQPDVFSMSTLASAWTKSKSPDASIQAEAILKYMEKQKMLPNVITYNSVLHAIATSNPTATTAAASAGPNTRTSDTSKRRQASSMLASSALEKVLRVKNIIRQMKKQHQDQLEQVQQLELETAKNQISTTATTLEFVDCAPDVYSYQMLILAWSNLAKYYVPPAWKSMTFSSSVSTPHSSASSSSSSADGKSITTTPQQNVEHIMKYLENEAYMNPKSSKCGANVHCYTAAIHTYTNSKTQRGKARHAYNLLQRLRQLYIKTGKKDAKPNVVVYTAVLNACARPIFNDEDDKQEAYDIAVLTMEELLLLSKSSTSSQLASLSLSPSSSVGQQKRKKKSKLQDQKDMVSPNFLTFAAFLSVCSCALLPSSQRDDIVERTFRQCCDYGQCGQIVLEKLKRAASPTLYNKLVGKYCTVSTTAISTSETTTTTTATAASDEGRGVSDYRNENDIDTTTISKELLPKEWTRNIRGERLKPSIVRR